MILIATMFVVAALGWVVAEMPVELKRL